MSKIKQWKLDILRFVKIWYKTKKFELESLNSGKKVKILEKSKEKKKMDKISKLWHKTSDIWDEVKNLREKNEILRWKVEYLG